MKTQVEIYTWSTCPYSKKAKALLQKKGIEYTEHCIDGDDLARAAMSMRAKGSKALPQIFINDQHIGGCDDIYALEEIGSLDEMFEGECALEFDCRQLAKVEIYTWSNCPYSARAKALLREEKVAYIEYCIDGDEVARAAMTKRAEGHNTLPQIFINDRSVGGCEDLHILAAIGSLDELLSSISKATDIGKKISDLKISFQ